MARDYAKFVPAKTRAKQKNSRSGLVVSVLLLLTGCAVAIYIGYEKPPLKTMFSRENMAVMTSHATELWQSKKKTVQPLVKVAVPKKIVAVNMIKQKEAAPPVRFDFYNELPNMQMVAKAPSKPVVAPVDIVSSVEKKSGEVVQAKKSVFDPQELASLLSAEEQRQSQPQQYFVQLGLFHTEEAAKRMSSVLAGVGFDAEVTRVESGKSTLYRVQQGSFPTKEMAKLTQLQLRKHGIVSVIRKVT
jgi:cell division protein FtsN